MNSCLVGLRSILVDCISLPFFLLLGFIVKASSSNLNLTTVIMAEDINQIDDVVLHNCILGVLCKDSTQGSLPCQEWFEQFPDRSGRMLLNILEEAFRRARKLRKLELGPST